LANLSMTFFSVFSRSFRLFSNILSSNLFFRRNTSGKALFNGATGFSRWRDDITVFSCSLLNSF
jgi:hypothetical protein